MLPPREITTKKQYTKFFVSNKKRKQKLYFSIDYKIDVFEDSDKKVNFSIDANLSYLLLVKNNKCFKTQRISDKWDLISIPFSKSCSLRDCVLIQPGFRSFGIGSFLLNEILSIANEFIPDYSLRAGLSYEDEKEYENHLRRDTLYKNLGFNFEEKEVSNNDKTVIKKEIYIDKLSNLNLNRDFDYIEEIEPFKIADVIFKMSEKIALLRKQKKSFWNKFRYFRDLFLEQSKTLWKYNFTAGTIILIMVLTIYFKYIH